MLKLGEVGGEVVTGFAVARSDLGGRALRDDAAAVRATAGAEVENLVALAMMSRSWAIVSTVPPWSMRRWNTCNKT